MRGFHVRLHSERRRLGGLTYGFNRCRHSNNRGFGSVSTLSGAKRGLVFELWLRCNCWRSDGRPCGAGVVGFRDRKWRQRGQYRGARARRRRRSHGWHGRRWLNERRVQWFWGCYWSNRRNGLFTEHTRRCASGEPFANRFTFGCLKDGPCFRRSR